MEARVAVLEQIVNDTKDILVRLDTRMDRIKDRQASEFKWLLALGLGGTGFLFATMAHGFHWL